MAKEKARAVPMGVVVYYKDCPYAEVVDGVVTFRETHIDADELEAILPLIRDAMKQTKEE